uniref:Uncharacterized protein n=1 Tax=Meloidogyne enterolobii TaxID=390850 RepID=A0A6V7UKU5_MELEN|nr:unnamed protein product [Meloidogyne enterolobii]
MLKNIHIILQMYEWEKEVENKDELFDEQKNLVEIDTMKVKKTTDKKTKDELITKLNVEKKVENKIEFSDVQKELLEIGGMKDRMTETMLEILNIIYTKNEITKEEVEHLLEEKLGRISEAETEFSKSGYIDQREIVEGLEKRRKTFSSIKSFMNDYNQAVEQIVLLLNKEKPELQQIATYYKN